MCTASPREPSTCTGFGPVWGLRGWVAGQFGTTCHGVKVRGSLATCASVTPWRYGLVKDSDRGGVGAILSISLSLSPPASLSLYVSLCFPPTHTHPRTPGRDVSACACRSRRQTTSRRWTGAPSGASTPTASWIGSSEHGTCKPFKARFWPWRGYEPPSPLDALTVALYRYIYVYIYMYIYIHICIYYVKSSLIECDADQGGRPPPEDGQGRRRERLPIQTLDVGLKPSLNHAGVGLRPSLRDVWA